MKAGIMELADIYVVNKADLAGAPKIASEIKRILNFNAAGREGWVPQVLLTSIQDAGSIEHLSAEIDRHQTWLKHAGIDPRRQIERARYRLRSLLARQTAELAAELPDHFFDLPFREQYAGALESIRSKQAAGPAPESPAA
jgi:LAO/AO transport system kinase